MRATYMLAIGLALMPAAAFAGETITYTYDAKGRLFNVVHAGGPADGQTATYAFDAADNRTTSQVTGAHGRVIVVPLHSLTPIIIH